MKVVIAGSRTIKELRTLQKSLDRLSCLNNHILDEITTVISGKAIGVDTLGEKWATAHNIKVASRPADWSLGRGAGHIRNGEMADEADFGIILWDGESPGTRGMIREMQKRNKPYFLDVVKDV